jgi:riboflavin kinase/FMN adenylyltransferase
VEHSEYQWLPAIGIYVVTVEIAGQKYLGMASIGRNVTFGDDGPMTVEINLIDFNQNIYGEVVRVNWLAHGRGEIKFQTADELVTQLGKDEAATRQYLKNHPDILH